MAEEIKRQLLKNKIDEVIRSSQADNAEASANLSRAIKNFISSPPGSENFGQVVSGFISYAESVKPRGTKKDPTPSKLSGSVPGINTEETPSSADKSSIDTLVGKTSKDSTVVKKLFADGSPKGIRAAISQHLTDNKDEINAAMKEANKALNDPVLKEKAKELGIPEEAFTALAARLDTDITTFAQDLESEKAVEQSKKVSNAQMRSLGNPYGSFKSKISVPGVVNAGDPLAPGSLKIQEIESKTGFNFSAIAEQNPFGSLGIDFGNILGAASSVSSNLPVQKDIGVKIPAKVIDADTSEEVAESITSLVKEDGSTNIAEAVEEAEKVKAEPTTPVVDLNSTTNRLSSDGFLYGETAIGYKEITLAAKTSTRIINNLNFTWTGSAMDRQYASGEEYNKKIIEMKKDMSAVANLPIDKRASWAHIFVRKNGTLDLILPIDKFGVYDHITDDGIKDEANKILEEGITIVIDAGHEVPHAEATNSTYGPKSITPEQMKSLGKLIKMLTYCYSASVPYSWDRITGNSAFGIGLDIEEFFAVNARIPRKGLSQTVYRRDTRANS